MSDFSETAGQQNNPGPPQKKSNWWVWLLLAFGGLGLLSFACCCGGFYYFGSNAVVKAPEKVDARRAEIADITFDDSFEPLMAMDFLFMRAAIYKRGENDGFLYLIDMVSDKKASLDDLEVQMRNSVENGMNGDKENSIERLELVKAETREYTIKGETRDFEFVEGKSADGRTFYDVSGAFVGKERNAFIYLRVPADEYDETRIRSIIESIK